jgi:hypothetical protein
MVPAVTSSARVPRVSVVMPVFNAEPYLAEAVSSILTQSLVDLELVAVDDGSDDGSRATLERHAQQDHRVRILPGGRRLGIAAALNLGLGEARSDLVAIAHADDVALPDRLARQADFLEAEPRVAALGTALVTIDASGRRGPLLRFPTDRSVIRSTLLRHNCLAHPSVMLRRSAVAGVGGYRFDSVEDYDLWLRLAERFELANLSQAHVLYRLHPGQVSIRQLREMESRRLAVRVAGRARSRGRADPLAGERQLTPAVIARAGVHPRKVKRAIEAEWLGRAAILAELEADGALDANIALPSPLGAHGPRKLNAARKLLRADGLLVARRPVAGLAQVAAAFCVAPGYTLERLGSWLVERYHSRRAGRR